MKGCGRVLSTLALAGFCICLFFGAGCATYKPIPSQYLQPTRSAVILVRRMPERPQMMDSGQGGIIGAIVTATSRAERMREQLAGIQGDQVKEALLQEFKGRMAEHFNLADTNQDVRIEITVNTWGWFVPTIDFGIKVGEYQSQLVGHVRVFEVISNKEIAYALIQIQRPLGLKPEEQTARAAVTEVARVFAREAEEALIHSLKPELASGGFVSH
jgi:hypothetical protein